MELWTRALRDPRAGRVAPACSTTAGGRTIAAVVAEGQAAGEFGGPDPERAALELAALIDGLAVQVALGDALVTPELMRVDLHRGRRAAARGRARVPAEVAGVTRPLAPRAAPGGRRRSRSPATGSPAAPSRARSTARRRAGRSSPRIDGDLLIYNWAQYMDPALKKRVRARSTGSRSRGQLRQPRGDGGQAPGGRPVRHDLAVAPSTSPGSTAEGLLAQLRPHAAAATPTASRPSTTRPGGTRTTSTRSPTPTTRPGSPGARTRSPG